MLRKVFYIFYQAPEPTVKDLVCGMLLIGIWLAVAFTLVIEI